MPSYSQAEDCLHIQDTEIDAEHVIASMHFFEDVSRVVQIDGDLSLTKAKQQISDLPKRTVKELSGYSNRKVWTTICLINETETPRVTLKYSYPSMQRIRVHLYDRLGNLLATQESGKLVALKERKLKDTDYLFELMLSKDARYTAVISFESSSSMQFPLSILTGNSLYEKTQSKYLGFGVYYGLILLILVFSLVLFMAFRGLLFLSYFLYIASVLFAQLSLQGVAFRFIWPGSVEWNKVSTIFFVNMMFLALCFFTSVSLETRTHLPRLNLILRLFSFVALCLSIQSIFAYGTGVVRLTGILTAALPFVVIPIGIGAFHKGVEFARFYLLGVSCYLIGASAYGLKDAGILSPNYLAENGIVVGSILEMVVFAIGISLKIRTFFEHADRLKVELQVKTALADLAAQVSHDIRSPLAALNASIFALERDPSSAIEVIKRSASRINNIANDMLDQHQEKLTTITQLEQTCRGSDNIDLNSFVLKLSMEKKLEFQNLNGTQITDNVSSQTASIVFPESALSRIVSNLVNNAVEACGNEGYVTIFSRVYSSEVTISIVDNGVGISPENLQKIGSKGFSFGGNRKGRGNGLGVWHAIETLRKYNSDLRFQSQLGKGTIATIRIPIARKDSNWGSGGRNRMKSKSVAMETSIRV